MECNRNLSKVYAAKGEYGKFLDYFQQFADIRDSIYNKESSRQIAEMQTIYETEKKENRG